MPYFQAEPQVTAQPAQTGILLINLGTPDAPSIKALRRYLKQFLSDRRVVELPRFIWWPVLNGIVLNTRPAQSARKYATIWTKEGAPLLIYTQKQAKLLRDKLDQIGLHHLMVDFAMRYGNPSIETTLQRMRIKGIKRLLIVPLYPQYCAASSATACDQVFRTLMRWRNLPEIHIVRHFHTHPGYIQALAHLVRQHWAHHGKPDKLVISFHGMPQFTHNQGDPYHDECQQTATLLSQALEWNDIIVSFQSRFGKTKWLQPYTHDILVKLGKAKTTSVDVICPGFVADCLETLEEIALEGKATFLQHGGGQFRYIPCLNSEPNWINALADIICTHLCVKI